MIESFTGVSLIAVGLFLLAIACNMIRLIQANKILRVILDDHDSGINIISGLGGDQTGSVMPDKKLSQALVRNLQVL